MILDKQIRAMVVEKLQNCDDIIAVVDPTNILNFYIKKIDMNNTPAINVFTLDNTDNADENAVITDLNTQVIIEITGTSADVVDDIENLIDICLVDDSTIDKNYESIEGLYSPIYKNNRTLLDDEGTQIRIVKSITFKFNSKTLKGAMSEFDVLSQFNGELIVEKDVVVSQLNNEIEVIQ